MPDKNPNTHRFGGPGSSRQHRKHADKFTAEYVLAMTKVLKFDSAANSFGPKEVHSLIVALENTCAAVLGPRPSPVRERIAAMIVSIAIAGERDATNIYLKCLDQLQHDGVPVFRSPVAI
jgi:hypothetical protein